MEERRNVKKNGGKKKNRKCDQRIWLSCQRHQTDAQKFCLPRFDISEGPCPSRMPRMPRCMRPRPDHLLVRAAHRFSIPRTGLRPISPQDFRGTFSKILRNGDSIFYKFCVFIQCKVSHWPNQSMQTLNLSEESEGFSSARCASTSSRHTNILAQILLSTPEDVLFKYVSQFKCAHGPSPRNSLTSISTAKSPQEGQ